MPLPNSGSPRANGRTPPVRISSPSREYGGPSQAKGAPARNGYRGQSPARQPLARDRDAALRGYAPRLPAEFRPLTARRGSARNWVQRSRPAQSTRRSFQSLPVSTGFGESVLADIGGRPPSRVGPVRFSQARPGFARLKLHRSRPQ